MDLGADDCEEICSSVYILSFPCEGQFRWCLSSNVRGLYSSFLATTKDH
jgi:hypothetical protein